jgi:putative transposase
MEWRELRGVWVPPDLRDSIVDFYNHWSARIDFTVKDFCRKIDIGRARFYEWQRRYGKGNEHNAPIPRDHWITEEEKKRIIDFYCSNPLYGYRRVTFMMMDQDVVFVSPSTVYNVLTQAGLVDPAKGKPSKKGKGFEQPLKPLEHWHVDISYINICGTFYYLCAVLDGCSRYIVHWDIRESMKEENVQIVLQKALELFPGSRPRVISDNGPQFVAREFKEFVRLSGMTHVRTAPYYPQSNGKIERWHKELKTECIRPSPPSSLKDAKEQISRFIHEYNHVRLHGAIGYVTPKTKLDGLEGEVFARRDKKLEEARIAREIARANGAAIFKWTDFAVMGLHDTIGNATVEDKALLGSNLSAPVA